MAPRSRPLVVGLTGGIGSGKSTVGRMLAARGAQVIDVDLVGREVGEVGGRAHDEIVARFGPGVVSGGRLDRPALASIVFSDPAELAALNAISHPAINEVLAERVAAFAPTEIVVLDMAILVESTLGRWPGGGYETVIVVEAPIETRIARAVARGMDEGDARARMQNQAGDDERRAVADHIIDNSGDEAALEREVDRVWAALGATGAG
jgi:dephospho-CoA kinase